MSRRVDLCPPFFIRKNKMDIETAKQKIKKLLALSKSPNENEAIAALEKAKQLMEEYGLNEQNCIYNAKKAKATKRYCPWRTVVSNTVAWLYNCYKYGDQRAGYFVFVGDDFEAFMAVEMYAYLIKAIERMAKRNIRKNAKYKFRKSYKQGVAVKLHDRIMTLGKSCSWAPQRESKIKAVSEYVKSQVNLETFNKKIKINSIALNRGFREAEGISLNRQATGHGGRYISG